MLGGTHTVCSSETNSNLDPVECQDQVDQRLTRRSAASGRGSRMRVRLIFSALCHPVPYIKLPTHFISFPFVLALSSHSLSTFLGLTCTKDLHVFESLAPGPLE